MMLASIAAACEGGGFGAFEGGVGDTPAEPPESTFKVLGTLNTPFVAIVSNGRSSWEVRATTPLTIVIVQNVLPARMIATKLDSSRALMSLEATQGFRVVDYASTSAPFGVAQIAMGGRVGAIKKPASPDVRIMVRGPAQQRFDGLIEDDDTAFVVQSRVPTLFLYDSPDGKVSAQFRQIQKFGPFSVVMTVNGEVVARASGRPRVTIRQP
jgi:hypothetical protein